MGIFSKLLTLAAVVSVVSAMYESAASKVQTLDSTNFREKVLESDELWLVEFYAPWCGHCKNLEPEWEKAAKLLKGVVNIGAVNADEDKHLGGQYVEQGFPTIKVFGLGKKKSKGEDYTGGRTADAIVNFALDKLNSQVKRRLNGKDSSSSSSGSKSSGSKSGGYKTEDNVIVLNQANFDDVVMKSKDIWIVEFYAPWCGHCKNLEPEYKVAAANLKGQVKVGKVDATVETGLAQRFGIQGFPTLKVFGYGKKKDSAAIPYNGERSATAITAFMMDMAEKADIEPEVYELVKQEIYDDECKGPVICMVSFLPNIYDSNAKERNNYI